MSRADVFAGVLAELVALKDGPRDADYERRKPLAWERARAVLAAAEPAAEQARAGALTEAEAAAETLQTAIDAAHEEQRQTVALGRGEEGMTRFQHWSATAGWLASRIRAIKRGDEPDWPDAMNSEGNLARCPCGHLAWVDHSGTPMTWDTSPPAGCDHCSCERTEEEADEAGRAALAGDAEHERNGTDATRPRPSADLPHGWMR